MNNNDGKIPDFEKFPGSSKEKERVVPPEQDFEKAMASGVPEFAGFGAGMAAGVAAGEVAADKYGVAKPENMYYGEAVDEITDVPVEDPDEEYVAGVANAAALINYGLNAAAREMGVETVVQKLKGFDVSGREDPIKDFFEYLGVDTPAEYNEVRGEGEAALASEQAFRGGVNAPEQRRSVEGAFKAIEDMKELIIAVEGADPRYEELREGARSAGKGYFEYAVQGFGVRGLTELFQVLAQQRKKAEAEETQKDAAEETAAAEGEGGDAENAAPGGDGGMRSGNENGQPGAEQGDSLEQRIRNGERLNPEILRRVA